MDQANEKQVPQEPETTPKETELESEDLENVAGGKAVPMYMPNYPD